MAMNPSIVLQEIEKSLGATIQVLELSADEIMDIVEKTTIPTFSKYYPYFMKIEIIPERDKVPKRFNTFYIRTDEEILGVSKVFAENYLGNSGLPMSVYDSDPINRQILADIASMYLQPITFDYETPNIISIFPKTYLIGPFTIEIKVNHPCHMATIPMNMKDDFIELAVYDVRRALYPIRQRFANINTTFGNIELFMDKLDSAEEDRKTLLEKFRVNFAKNPKRRKMFIG